MVYGGQRDGVRGRPVRKHRVYTGPRTVTGSPPLTPPRRVRWRVRLSFVGSRAIGPDRAGDVRVFMRKVNPCGITFVLFPPPDASCWRQVWVRENETKVRAAARLHCRRARVLHAAPDDASAHERRRRRHYPHANRGVQASDNRVTFRRAAGTGDHRGEHLHVQDASIACYALICIGTARCP